MIIPSIDIMDGKAVQLRQGKKHMLDGGDPLARLEEMAVVGEVAIVDLDAALGRGSNTDLIRRMLRRAPCRVGGGIRDLVTAREWLDAGAEKIVVGTAAEPSFCSELPRERLIAAVDCRHGAVVVDGWRTRTGDAPISRIRRLREVVGGFLLTQVEHEGCLQGFDLELVEQAAEAARTARVTAAGGITTTDEISQLARIGADAQIGMALYTGRLSLGEGYAAVLERGTPWQPQELSGESRKIWPTVVCDEAGASLGLVWSTRESVAAAIDERRGIYWSRSRNKLWRKGESSGNTQVLLRADLDCDRDALRFTVRQMNGFCHTGTHGCWEERFSLASLGRVLADRSATSESSADEYSTGEPRSGTMRLLADPDLLAAKLVEEARELAEARDRDHVVSEAADLLYFAMVAAGRAGVSIAEVERELALRNHRLSRRPMTAKRRSAGDDR